MIDPISAALLGTAFTESLKFLYGQASELLKKQRERRDEASREPFVNDVAQSVPLDTRPDTLVADVGVLAEHSDRLTQLAARLAPYSEGWQKANAEAESLAGELRSVLETIYGQRLTFQGEQREPTGTKVSVRQVAMEIEPSGELLGAEGRVPLGGLDVVQQIGRLRGSATGYTEGRGAGR